eukprot:gene11059-biopygen4824
MSPAGREPPSAGMLSAGAVGGSVGGIGGSVGNIGGSVGMSPAGREPPSAGMLSAGAVGGSVGDIGGSVGDSGENGSGHGPGADRAGRTMESKEKKGTRTGRKQQNREQDSGAGVARATGNFWLGVARAWRGHGAGVARAFPVPPGPDFSSGPDKVVRMFEIKWLQHGRQKASFCTFQIRENGDFLLYHNSPSTMTQPYPARDLYPMHRKLSWVRARSAIAGWIGLNQAGHGWIWPGILRIHATHATHAGWGWGDTPHLVQISGVGPRAGPCPWDGPG